MSDDDRRLLVDALIPAKRAAFGPGEYVEQESFVRASEILALAVQAGIGPDVSVLDLCCGIGGPGRFVARELGCVYLGVDASEDAVAVATERAGAARCRFEAAKVPPLPPGTFDVVLLLETLLAFRDKRVLLDEVARALPAGGRFAFTLEEGEPLTEPERARMPAADTVWLTPLEEVRTLLERAGFVVRWEEDWSESHAEVAAALADAYTADSAAIGSRIGRPALEELVASHRLWSEWLARGRARTFAFAAERLPTDPVAAGERSGPRYAR
ncbi:MAG TPA: methyltransferase domain-containing protein [Gaiellaceae bacterium]|nr:methyltransferase domain-containing protein [Gaiellaceae bacterium]